MFTKIAAMLWTVCIAIIIFPCVVSAGWVDEVFDFIGNDEVRINLFSTLPLQPTNCYRIQLLRNGTPVAEVHQNNGTFTYNDEGLQKGVTYEYRIKHYSSCNGGEEALVADKTGTVTTGQVRGILWDNLILSEAWTLFGPVSLATGVTLTLKAGAIVDKVGDPGYYRAGIIELFDNTALDVDGTIMKNITVQKNNSNTQGTKVSITNSLLEDTYFDSNGFDTFNVFTGNSGVCTYTEGQESTWGFAHFSLSPFGALGPDEVPIRATENTLPGCWVKVLIDTSRAPSEVTVQDNQFENLYIGPSASAGDFTSPITVRNNRIARSITVFYGSWYVEIEDNVAEGVLLASYLETTSSGEIKRKVRRNRLTPPSEAYHSSTGINFKYSAWIARDALVEENVITCVNGSDGIISSADNSVFTNTITGCYTGISLGSGNAARGNTISATYGIRLDGGAASNTVEGNIVSGGAVGMLLDGYSSANGIQNNTFRGNIFDKNWTNVELVNGAKNNLFYNNIFRKRSEYNAKQVDFEWNTCQSGGSTVKCPNTWNTAKSPGQSIIGGAFIGGNFWTDYTGADTDGDGLGNTPFPINNDGSNVDNLPLVFDIVVNTTGDQDDANLGDGKCDVNPPQNQCTLRAAINEANTRQGRNAIGFNIPGGGTPVIQPVNPLPPISDAVTIDGTAQSGGAVVVDGTNAGNGTQGLTVNAQESAVKGLVIRNFNGRGIYSGGGIHLENVQLWQNGGGGIRLSAGNLTNSGYLQAIGNGASDPAAGHGVQIPGTGNAVLTNVVISGNAGGGIYVMKGHVTIGGTNNEIKNNAQSGIFALNGEVETWGGTDISDNGGHGVNAGSAVSIRDWAKINRNRQGGVISGDAGVYTGVDLSFLEIIGNGADNQYSGHGIQALGRGYVNVSNVKINGNRGGGIYAANHHVEIGGADNEIKLNGQSGINTSFGSVTIRGGADITDNGGHGIIADYEVRLHDWARINRNKRGGILSQDAGIYAGGDVTFLEIIGNGADNPSSGHGIHAKGEGNLFVGNVKINNNSGSGVFALDHDVRISGAGNEVKGNGATGIFVLNGTLSLDGGTDVSENGNNGIWVAGTISISDWARANNNLRTGIHSEDESIYAADATFVEVIGNGLNGVEALSEKSASAFVNTTVLSNTGVGFMIGTDLQLTGGRVCGNKGGDMSVKGELALSNVIFCDEDSDGASDSVEDGAPNGGDGDGNGVPDKEQGNAASLMANDRYTTIRSDSGKNLLKTSGSTAHPFGAALQGVDFSQGTFGFTLAGGQKGLQALEVITETVTLFLHGGMTPDTFWVFGGTPENPDPHWYEFLYDGTTGAQFQDNQVILYLRDGLRGDNDLLANGDITFSGGPGIKGTGPGLLITPPSHDFGVVPLNGTSSPITMTLTNIGVAPLSVGAVSPDAPFLLENDDCSGTTVLPSAGCTLNLRYKADATAVACLRIPSNATADPVAIPLSGIAGNFPLLLSAGWNFISIPLVPENAALAALFSGILSQVRIIWGYDNEKKQWVRYQPGGPANTLIAIEPGKGYWIYMDSPAALTISGARVIEAVTLHEGWNLAGFSGIDAGIDQSLGSMSGRWAYVWHWEGGTWMLRKAPDLTYTTPFPEVTTFMRGKAFWIRIKTGAGQEEWRQ
jgi:CSLREA domain-containing protein